MQLKGTLRSWNDERGFGFIAPTSGRREIFVHVSAFVRDGSRPTVGETVVYELGREKNGEVQAVRVTRSALGEPSTYPSRSHSRPRRRTVMMPALLTSAIVIGLGAYGYKAYRDHNRRVADAAQRAASAETRTTPTTERFRCDGRTHCSQMTSCQEATYFLKNCPGTQMDGNNDGVPCEQQWCTR
jgi:cold shock CspA family protein